MYELIACPLQFTRPMTFKEWSALHRRDRERNCRDARKVAAMIDCARRKSVAFFEERRAGMPRSSAA
jgi:hypothetical protein